MKRQAENSAAMVAEVEAVSGAETESQEEEESRNRAARCRAKLERAGIVEALIFVSDEPLTRQRQLPACLKEEPCCC